MIRQKINIIIAEDDPDDRLLMEDALGENGIQPHQIIFVEDGEALLEKLQNITDPCLIFLDLNMPRMDGRQALKRIKDTHALKHIPVIVLTTSNSEEDILMAYQNGTNTYFTKPALFNDLVEIIATIKNYWFEKAAFLHKTS